MELPGVLKLSDRSGAILPPLLTLLLASNRPTVCNAQNPTVDHLAYAMVTNDDGSQATLRMDLWHNATDGEH